MSSVCLARSQVERPNETVTEPADGQCEGRSKASGGKRKGGAGCGSIGQSGTSIEGIHQWKGTSPYRGERLVSRGCMNRCQSRACQSQYGSSTMASSRTTPAARVLKSRLGVADQGQRGDLGFVFFPERASQRWGRLRLWVVPVAMPRGKCESLGPLCHHDGAQALSQSSSSPSTWGTRCYSEVWLAHGGVVSGTC